MFNLLWGCMEGRADVVHILGLAYQLHVGDEGVEVVLDVPTHLVSTLITEPLKHIRVIVDTIVLYSQT